MLTLCLCCLLSFVLRPLQKIYNIMSGKRTTYQQLSFGKKSRNQFGMIYYIITIISTNTKVARILYLGSTDRLINKLNHKKWSQPLKKTYCWDDTSWLKKMCVWYYYKLHWFNQDSMSLKPNALFTSLDKHSGRQTYPNGKERIQIDIQAVITKYDGHVSFTIIHAFESRTNTKLMKTR